MNRRRHHACVKRLVDVHPRTPAAVELAKLCKVSALSAVEELSALDGHPLGDLEPALAGCVCRHELVRVIRRERREARVAQLAGDLLAEGEVLFFCGHALLDELNEGEWRSLEHCFIFQDGEKKGDLVERREEKKNLNEKHCRSMDGLFHQIMVEGNGKDTLHSLFDTLI